MNKAKKKVVSGILGVGLSVMLAGSSVFAAGGSYKTLSGDGGIYTKGSKSGYEVKVEGPFSEFKSVTVDGKTIVKDKDYSVSGKVSSDSKEDAYTNTSEEPETSEAPETEEPTTAGPEATPEPTTAGPEATPEPTTAGPEATPEPTTAGPEATPEPTTAGPEATPEPTIAGPEATPEPTIAGPEATQSAENGQSVFLTVKDLLKAIVSPLEAEAASDETNVKVFSSYMDTLSVGTHKIAVNFKDGTATATVTVKAASATNTNSATPKTGDTSGITMYAILALLSGSVLAVLGRKRVQR